MDSRSRRHGEAQSPSKASEARPGLMSRGVLPVLLGAVVVLGAGLWLGGLLPGFGGGGSAANPAPAAQSSADTGQSQTLPDFIASASPRVQSAYEFAASHGAELAYIPCYCGCGQHAGHKSVRDCFIRSQTSSSITYDDHGSGCDICVSILLDVKTKLGEGQSLASIRRYVDTKYSKIGPGTDTPLPPGMEE